MQIPRYSVLVALALACLVALPFVGSSYLMVLCFIVNMHLVMAASYDIVGGYMGYINLGHASFFGIGAYAFGVLYLQGGGVLRSLAAGGLAAAVFAALVSVPLLRIRGIYFALATFGMVKLLELITINLREVTGGSWGLTISGTTPARLTYALSLVLALGALAANGWIARSRLGLALVSIREDEEVADVSGVRVFWSKWLAMVISSVMPGIMGGLYLWQVKYIDPHSAFGSEITFVPVVMAMFGGSGVLVGPILGTVFLSVIEEVLWTRIPYLHLATYGLVFLLVVLFMPGGVARTRWFLRVARALQLPRHYGFVPQAGRRATA
jgi:branched-chain amino acid transport system permease protein